MNAATSTRLAFISKEDPSDITGWSGINYFMSKALRDAGFTIVPSFGFQRCVPKHVLLKKIVIRLLSRRYYEVDRNPAVVRAYAKQIEQRLAGQNVDAVFSTGTVFTADYRGKAPLFFWTDATVPALFKIYPGYEKFAPISYKEALRAEKRAIKNARGMFFSSDWAARSAIEDLGANPESVHVVQFGANFVDEPLAEASIAAAQKRSSERVILLFAGVQWQRKGGAKALKIAQAASQLGLPVRLHILGVEKNAVPKNELIESSENLELVWHGRISKASEEGRALIAQLFAESHFLLLPTIADCTPMVFAEANAYAMPVVTHDVGGIPTMIRNGVNGHMFALNSSEEEQAAWIFAQIRDAVAYKEIAHASRREYETRFRWESNGRRVGEIISNALAKNPHG